MQAALELYDGNKKLLRRFIDKSPFTLGGHPSCDLCIPELQPFFGTLSYEDGHLTFINQSGHPIDIAGDSIIDKCRLAAGDTLSLGSIFASVQFLETVQQSGQTKTLAQQAATSKQGFCLVAPEVFAGQQWPVNETGLSIGTHPDNHIILQDPYVSSFHARVTYEAGRCILTDLDSRNGTFIGEHQIRQGEIPMGVQIRMGQTLLLLQTKRDHLPGPASKTLVGHSPAIQTLRETIRKIARHHAPVLITGESGTGKEVVAHMIRALSPRAELPYLALNCGALGRELIGSELFGHERGAFTGASHRKQGAFETANQGTLFLDEIGELPLELQPQLLRVLESGEIRRLGSTQIEHVDVRIIAATNRHLEEQVAQGLFRSDLLYRLHVLVIELPPLRERLADLQELAQTFIREFSPPGVHIELSQEALHKLINHSWPGNIRELRNVLQRAILLREGDTLNACDLSFTSMPSSKIPEPIPSNLSSLERHAIVQALEQSRGNKKDAALLLGISRSTLHRKLNELEL